jgi:hypothetical protein
MAWVCVLPGWMPLTPEALCQYECEYGKCPSTVSVSTKCLWGFESAEVVKPKQFAFMGWGVSTEWSCILWPCQSVPALSPLVLTHRGLCLLPRGQAAVPNVNTLCFLLATLYLPTHRPVSLGLHPSHKQSLGPTLILIVIIHLPWHWWREAFGTWRDKNAGASAAPAERCD